MISEGFWSEWGDLNTQPRHPKCRALPIELHPDIRFFATSSWQGKKQRFFYLWSFMWSKLLLCHFRQSCKIPQTQESQGFAVFRLAPSRIAPRHTQTSRGSPAAIVALSIAVLRKSLRWFHRRLSGSGRRIRTLTYGVRVRCATITQSRYVLTNKNYYTHFSEFVNTFFTFFGIVL